MSAIWTPLIGRFGNQCFQYAAARAIADRDGLELHTPEWAGERIFSGVPVAPRSSDCNKFEGYGQDQKSLIYTRRQVKEWLAFNPEVIAAMELYEIPEIAAHRRVGDYANTPGYVVVSELSYEKATARLYPGETPSIQWFTEESPHFWPGVAGWLVDFYLLTKAEILLRGNSSFSWWAATLGDGRVLSPVIDGLPSGEHDCKFVEGNWPRLCSYPNVTDLHLMP